MIAGGRTRAPREREGARGPTAPPEVCGAPQPRGRIRIMEGRGDRSQLSDIGSKGKEKARVCLGLPLEKLMSPPSLKALLSLLYSKSSLWRFQVKGPSPRWEKYMARRW